MTTLTEALSACAANFREIGKGVIDKQRVIYDYCADQIDALNAEHGSTMLALLRERSASLAPIECDEAMDRTYIPLPAEWEVQTRGKGSTFRIARTDGYGDRFAITEERVHAELEQMARDIHARYTALLRERDELRRLVDELATDLENEIENRRSGELPRRIERDLIIVREARAFLTGITP